MNIDFKESGIQNFYHLYQKQAGIRHDNFKNNIEDFIDDEYFYEGTRVGHGINIEFFEVKEPLKLEVTFMPPSKVDKYWYETGLLILTRSPIWHQEGIKDVRASNNRLFLPSSEEGPLEFSVKPHKAKKSIFVAFLPAIFDAKNRYYNSMSAWAALNFKEENSHEYSFMGSANNEKVDFTDMHGTLKSLNYDLSKNAKIM